MGGRDRLYINVEPTVLLWALERSNKSVDGLSTKPALKRLQKWLNNDGRPTLLQLEVFADATYTPFGYLLLSEPPDDPPSPIPHFRTMDNGKPRKRSINLEDTIKLTERRQEWIREYLIEVGAEPLPFVNSCTIDGDPIKVADNIRSTLDLPEKWVSSSTKEDVDWRTLRDKIENRRIFLSRTSMVRHHYTRRLDPEEFRGFVLVDDYAPFIFVNSADYPGAQLFTLAHELAHVWVGESASFDLRKLNPANNQLERACNKIAAELLVPTHAATRQWNEFKTSDDPYRAMARRFGVSKIVAARRALDTNCISQDQFDVFYDDYKQREDDWKAEQKRTKKSGGPAPDKTGPAYISPRFLNILTAAVGEGRILYREAYSLTDLSPKTFDTIKRKAEEEMIMYDT